MSVQRALAVGVVMLAALVAQPGHAQQLHEPPASSQNVLEGVHEIDEPLQTFLPKYKYELFLVGGYSGTFTDYSRQWPTLALGLEVLLLRPRAFDFGIYADWQAGRPDEARGRYSSAFGGEIMWRLREQSFWDFALLIRAAYVLDWEHPSDPMIRPGIGVQFSLVRFVALQAVADGLIATSHAFSNDTHYLAGFSIALKMGIAPLFVRWPQYAQKPVPTIDRSRAVCDDATRVCEAASRSATRDSLCDAALRALDPSQHSAGWNDPTGAFLDALLQELQTESPELRTLRDDHASSIQGLEDYQDKLRALGESKALDKKYSYLVTPVMIRDWFGCNADGHAPRDASGSMQACPTSQTCARDTGVVTP